jgi:hypothetical protein
MIDELNVLELCEHYRLEYRGGAKDVAETWNESDERIAEGGPTFDELASLGWMFFDGSHWIVHSAPPARQRILSTRPHAQRLF